MDDTNCIKIPSTDEIIEKAKISYNEHFNGEPVVCGLAPGRVNLIGEHVDYNQGFVFPMALPLVTVVVGEKNNSQKCRVITSSISADDPKEIEFELPEDYSLLKPGKPAWANYVKGVIANFEGKLTGFNAVIETSVPVGGGLSSSAALEVAFYMFLEGVADQPIPYKKVSEKVLACQKAEHLFSGMPCGIMDQCISFLGKKDQVLFLDCKTLEYTLVPLKDPNISILITDTNVKHQLAGSEYASRKKECEKAAAIFGKSSLRNVTKNELFECKQKLEEENVYSRALHITTEIRRTIKAAQALQDEDYVTLGDLMTKSHRSLKNDYEVSCPELDQVVDAALEIEGVYGSRMTGGGFGGCTVTLLDSDVVPAVIENIQAKYEGEPTFYVCRPADGAKTIILL